MTRLPFATALVLLGLVTFVVGCGGETTNTVKISGNVTVDGTPVDKGSITFVPADGNTISAGGVIVDGKYTADVPPGEKKVMVLGTKVVGTELVLEGVPDSGTRDKLETITHPIYNASHKTPLSASITEPTDSLNFDLSKNGK